MKRKSLVGFISVLLILLFVGCVEKKEEAKITTITLAVSNASLLANGVEKTTLTSVVKDQKGNAMPGTNADYYYSLEGGAEQKLEGNIFKTVKSGKYSFVARVGILDSNKVEVTATTTLSGITIELDPAGKNNIIANGVDYVNIKAFVKDQNGTTLSGLTVQLFEGEKEIVGKYTTTQQGIHTITSKVMYKGAWFLGSSVEITGIMPTADKIEIFADKTKIIANGKDKVVFSGIVKDKNGVVISGASILYYNENTSLLDGSFATDKEGVYSIVGKIGSITSNAIVVNAVTTITGVTIAADKTIIIANGNDSIVLSAKALDQNGKAIDNGEIRFYDNDVLLQNNIFKTTVIGEHVLSAKLGSFTKDIKVQGVLPVGANITVTSSMPELVSNGIDKITISAVIKDSSGFQVSGSAIRYYYSKETWSDASKVEIGSKEFKTTEAGVYYINVSDEPSTGRYIWGTPIKITATKEPVVTTITSVEVKVSKSLILANGADATTITSVVKDQFGKEMNGITVLYYIGSIPITMDLFNTRIDGDYLITAVAGNVTSAAVKVTAYDKVASIQLLGNTSNIIVDGQDSVNLSTIVRNQNTEIMESSNVEYYYAKSIFTTATAIKIEGSKFSTTEEGIYFIKAKIDNIESNVIDVTAKTTIGSIEISGDKTSICANGKDTLTVSYVVKDKMGKIMDNIVPKIYAGNTEIIDGKFTTTTAGPIAIVAIFDLARSEIIYLTADPQYVTKINISTDKITMLADGQDTITISSVAFDQKDVEMDNSKLEYFANGIKLESNIVKTVTPGTISIYAKYGTTTSNAVEVKAQTIPIKSIELKSDKSQIRADGKDTVIFAVVVRDNDGNEIKNQIVEYYEGVNKLQGNSFTTLEVGKDFVITAKIGEIISNAITIKSAEITPPENISGYPKSDVLEPNSVNILLKQNEAGKTYYQVCVNNDAVSTPTAVSIRDKSNSGVDISYGEISVGANTETTLKLSLIAGRNYYIYFASEDSLGNLQANVTKINFTSPLSADFVYVDGGTFMMGSDEYGPKHEVTLKSFYMDKYEVTQQDWGICMGAEVNPSLETGASLPVDSLTWYQAIRYCNAKTLKDGQGILETVYTIELDKNGNVVNVIWDTTKNGYRLPTEAEWEYAARGGKLTQNFSYSGSNDGNEVGWNGENSTYPDDSKYSHPVGLKKANELGIYDLSGNVGEFCWDWWDPYYSGSIQVDPKGPDTGTSKVVRGGDWASQTASTLSTARSVIGLEDKLPFRGFRIVRNK